MSNTLKLGNGQWATGKDTILAYNDLNSNYKPLAFSFSRDTSATVINKDGLIETVGSGEPRIDFKDNTKGALLLEPSRTNLFTYSEDFTQWQKLNSTVTDNSVISPDGSQNADLINYNITSSNGYIRIAHTASSVITFYVKYKDTQWLMVYGSGLGAGKFIDIKNSVIGGNVGSGASAEITNAGNGWKRVVLKSSSSNITQTSIYAASSDGSYATITLSGGVYLWGAQAESNASYPTSYIPTSGSAVTRVAESSSQTPPDGVIGQTEGSIYSEFKCLDDVANIMLWMRNPSGGAYADMIKLECGADNRLRFEVRASNVTSCSFIGDVLPTNIYYKVAVAYKQNDFVMYLNGVQISVDTSGNVPTCSEMYVGKYIDGGVRMGVVKDLKLYNTRLSNSELQALVN